MDDASVLLLLDEMRKLGDRLCDRIDAVGNRLKRIDEFYAKREKQLTFPSAPAPSPSPTSTTAASPAAAASATAPREAVFASSGSEHTAAFSSATTETPLHHPPARCSTLGLTHSESTLVPVSIAPAPPSTSPAALSASASTRPQRPPRPRCPGVHLRAPRLRRPRRAPPRAPRPRRPRRASLRVLRLRQPRRAPPRPPRPRCPRRAPLRRPWCRPPHPPRRVPSRPPRPRRPRRARLRVHRLRRPWRVPPCPPRPRRPRRHPHRAMTRQIDEDITSSSLTMCSTNFLSCDIVVLKPNCDAPSSTSAPADCSLEVAERRYKIPVSPALSVGVVLFEAAIYIPGDCKLLGKVVEQNSILLEPMHAIAKPVCIAPKPPWFSSGCLLSNILGSSVDAIKQPPDLHSVLYQHFILGNVNRIVGQGLMMVLIQEYDMVGYCWALLQLDKFHIDCASHSFWMLCSYFLKDNVALLTDDALAPDIVMHRPKPWPSFCCHMVEKVRISVQPPWQPPIQHPIWCIGAHIIHTEQCQSSIQDHSSVVGCWQHWLTLLKSAVQVLDTEQLPPSFAVQSNCSFQSCKLIVKPVVSKRKMEECLYPRSVMWLIPEVLDESVLMNVAFFLCTHSWGEELHPCEEKYRFISSLSMVGPYVGVLLVTFVGIQKSKYSNSYGGQLSYFQLKAAGWHKDSEQDFCASWMIIGSACELLSFALVESFKSLPWDHGPLQPWLLVHMAGGLLIQGLVQQHCGGNFRYFLLEETEQKFQVPRVQFTDMLLTGIILLQRLILWDPGGDSCCLSPQEAMLNAFLLKIKTNGMLQIVQAKIHHFLEQSRATMILQLIQFYHQAVDDP